MDDKVYYSRYGDLKEGIKQEPGPQPEPGYVETELWSNPDDSKGIKEMICLVDDIIGYEFLKIVVRNINNKVEYYDVIYDIDLIREIGAFAVISNDVDTETLYMRKCWLQWNGSKNELWCSGNVNQADDPSTNKNFRAIISKVYGIKKEV